MSLSKKKQNKSKIKAEFSESLGTCHSDFNGKPSTVAANSQRTLTSKQEPRTASKLNQECVGSSAAAGCSGNSSPSVALYKQGQIVSLGSSSRTHGDTEKLGIVVNHKSSPSPKSRGDSHPSQVNRVEISDQCANVREVAKKSKRKNKRPKSTSGKTLQTYETPQPQASGTREFISVVNYSQERKFSPCYDVQSGAFSGRETRFLPGVIKYNPFGPGKVNPPDAMKVLAGLNPAKHFHRITTSLPNTSSGGNVSSCGLPSSVSTKKKIVDTNRKRSVSESLPAENFKKDFSQAALINRYDKTHPSKVRYLGNQYGKTSWPEQVKSNNGPRVSQACNPSRETEPSQSCSFSMNQYKGELGGAAPKSQAALGVFGTTPLSSSRFHPPPVICFKSSSVPDGSKNAVNQREHMLPDGGDRQDDAFMEWEDIEDEKVLQNIKVLRQCCQDVGTLDQLVEEMDTNCLDVSEDSVDCVIVLDTNILISHLKFVTELSKNEYKAVGCPVLVIPWMVLKELDAFKGGTNRSKVRDSALESKARAAAHFINGCFSSRHPRVKGQSALEDKEHCIEIDVPDDSILNCCLQLKMKGKKVILLSNDVNFCNKAMATGIVSYGKEKMNKALILGNLDFGAVETLSYGANSSQTETEKQYGRTMLKFKVLLQEFLSKFLEREMKRVFKESWIKVILIKPPWSLLDSLKNFSKHWVAVFGFVMDKSGHKVIEDLISAFQTEESSSTGFSPVESEKVVQSAINLCDAIVSDNYHAMSLEYKNSFMSLLKVLRDSKTDDTKIASGGESLPLQNPAQVPQLPAVHSDKFSVFEAFQYLWTLVNNFCGVVCDTFGVAHDILYEKPENFPSVEEVKGRIPGALYYVNTIVTCLTGILELPESLLSAEHPMLLTLRSVIDSLVPPEFLVDKAVTCEKLLLFCIDKSTRVMLANGLSQFQEVQMNLLKIMNSFK